MNTFAIDLIKELTDDNYSVRVEVSDSSINVITDDNSFVIGNKPPRIPRNRRRFEQKEFQTPFLTEVTPRSNLYQQMNCNPFTTEVQLMTHSNFNPFNTQVDTTFNPFATPVNPTSNYFPTPVNPFITQVHSTSNPFATPVNTTKRNIYKPLGTPLQRSFKPNKSSFSFNQFVKDTPKVATCRNCRSKSTSECFFQQQPQPKQETSNSNVFSDLPRPQNVDSTSIFLEPFTYEAFLEVYNNVCGSKKREKSTSKTSDEDQVIHPLPYEYSLEKNNKPVQSSKTSDEDQVNHPLPHEYSLEKNNKPVQSPKKKDLSMIDILKASNEVPTFDEIKSDNSLPNDESLETNKLINPPKKREQSDLKSYNKEKDVTHSFNDDDEEFTIIEEAV